MKLLLIISVVDDTKDVIRMNLVYYEDTLFLLYALKSLNKV